MRLHIEEKDRMNMNLDGKMVGLRGISSTTVTSGGGVGGDPQCALGAGPRGPWGRSTVPSAPSAKGHAF